MKIANIDLDREVLVIAEIGNNHEGSFALAEELIGKAAQSGAGAVKFQTIVPELLVHPIQKERIAQLNKFKFTYDQFRKLKNTANNCGVLFLSTPFDLKSADELADYVPAFKIASGDNDFYPLLKKTAMFKKPIILSSGLAERGLIEDAVNYIKNIWNHVNYDTNNLAVLHCVVSYPTKQEEANLLRIRHLIELGVIPGYSDHTIGIEAAVLSVALGARIIEKHFTIDKNYSNFRDHSLSADPDDMRMLTERVREADLMLGRGTWELQTAELNNEQAVRRSIVAAREINEGAVISEDDIVCLRPRNGMVPRDYELLLGRRTNKKIIPGDYLSLDIVTGS